MSEPNINYFQEIEIKKPSDSIIKQIRTLISDGVLKPGDQLPSERALAQRFNVGRGYIREAIRKLEFYGILRTLPQRGTVVASLGVKALEGLISNVLTLDKDDFESLMETRAILEIHATRLAAVRATEEEIKELAVYHNEFERQVVSDEYGLEEDLLFHLKIAEFSKNNVLCSLVGLITPDIITISRNLATCSEGRNRKAFKEHEDIFLAIQAHDSNAAEEAMIRHMDRSIMRRKK